MATCTLATPAVLTNVSPATPIVLSFVDGGAPVTLSSIAVTVDGVSVYAASAPLAGWAAVLRVPVAGTHQLTLTPPKGFAYGATIPVAVAYNDGAAKNATFSFVVEADPSCWAGTLSALEQTFLIALPLLPLELLRRRFLNSLTTNQDPIKGARVMAQTLFDTEIGTALRKLYDFPPEVLTSKICERRRFLDIDSDLQTFAFLIQPAVQAAAGAAFVPPAYLKLIVQYLNTDYARYRVSATAALLAFAAYYLVGAGA